MDNKSSNKTKVIHLISGDLWAGAEVMAFNLLAQLKSYPDLELSVILLNEGRLADELRKSGLTVQVIDEQRHSFWQIARRIRAIVGDSRPELIHSHRYKENLLALTAAAGRNIKLVATQHGLPELGASKPPLSTLFKTRANFHILSRYFTTVAVSADVCKFLVERQAFREESTEVILNGIDLPDCVTPCGASQPFTVGSSGRLFQVKDFPLMVEIARATQALSKSKVRFELAGEGPERACLEALIERYGLHEQFLLRGHQDDMNAFYEGIDLYLNTSVHEGIPMTILEALARGLPVVAPAVGGICEIIENGVEGFLIEGRDPNQFAEKCLRILEDGNLRQMMSRAARDKAQQTFSSHKMAESYYRLYCRSLHPARVHRRQETAVSLTA